MSTRRTTRARAASQAPSEVSIAIPPTPSRRPGLRGGSEDPSRPAVGTRQSNAFGSTLTGAPRNDIRGGVEIGPVTGLLDGEREEPRRAATPAKRQPRQKRGGSTVSSIPASQSTDLPVDGDVSKSFLSEKDAAAHAQWPSSTTQGSPPESPLPGIDEEEDEFSQDEDETPTRIPPPSFNPRAEPSRLSVDSQQGQSPPEPQQSQMQTRPQVHQQHQQQAQRATVQQATQQGPQGGSIQNLAVWAVSPWIRDAPANAGRYAVDLFRNYGHILRILLPLVGGLLLAGLVAFGLRSGHFHWYGTNGVAMKHNVAQLLPQKFSSRVFASSELDNIKGRVWKLEQDVLLLTQRPYLSDAAVKELEDVLPNIIVARRDRLHRMVLPGQLWEAIRRRIQDDPNLAYFAYSGQQFSDPSVPHKQLEAAIRSSADEFFRREDLKTKMVDGRFAALIDNARLNDVIISRAEAVELIKENFENHMNSVKKTMERMDLNYEMIAAKIASASGSFDQAELQKAVEQALGKMQLGTLAHVNINANIQNLDKKINHFSPNSGAIVNPRHTSPSFEFEHIRNLPIYKFWLHNLVGNPIPVAKAPFNALTEWNEQGQCWCSQANHNDVGATLAVITTHDVYPEEIVIEHIHPGATFEPGSVPRYMELLAFVSDVDVFKKALPLSNDLFPRHWAMDQQYKEDHDGDSALPDGYLRIGAWKFDAERMRPETIQAFDVQLDLKMLGIKSHRFIVRATDNWGGVPYTCFYRIRMHGEYDRKSGVVKS